MLYYLSVIFYIKIKKKKVVIYANRSMDLRDSAGGQALVLFGVATAEMLIQIPDTTHGPLRGPQESLLAQSHE